MLNILWMIAIILNLAISIYRKNVELSGAWFVAALALSLQFLPM